MFPAFPGTGTPDTGTGEQVGDLIHHMLPII